MDKYVFRVGIVDRESSAGLMISFSASTLEMSRRSSSRKASSRRSCKSSHRGDWGRKKQATASMTAVAAIRRNGRRHDMGESIWTEP